MKISKKIILILAVLLAVSFFILFFSIKKSIREETKSEIEKLPGKENEIEISEVQLREGKSDYNKEDDIIGKFLKRLFRLKRKPKPYFKLENPTPSWTNFYGRLTINGKPAQPGDEIAAFDPDGILSGAFIIKDKGYYGFLHVYADDPLTSIDEGAVIGDKITFKVFDLNKDKEISVNESVIWEAYKTTRADLEANKKSNQNEN